VVGTKQHIALIQHALEGEISRVSGSGLQATTGRKHLDIIYAKGGIQCIAMPLAKIGPSRSVCMKPMINVDSRNGWTVDLRSDSVQSVQECNAVGASRERHPPVGSADYVVGKRREKFAQLALTLGQFP
jgi:hypothetical protein